MPKFQLVTRIHVLTAIKVHDQRGADDFLADLGFSAGDDELLVERGKRYPARALLAYAHGRATGTALTAAEVPAGATKVLTDLGFNVVSRAELERPATARARTPRATTPRAPRAPRATTKAPPRPEPVVRLCPACYTALPVSGRCDYCD